MREVYIERHLEKEVKKASRFYPVVLVCGQRQVGKSTMLYKIKEKSRNYVTFDDNAIIRLAKKEIDLLIVKNGSITPIEIKKNKNPDDATKNFDVLNKFKMNVKKGSIICMSEEFIPYDRKADLCPVSSIL